jgi:cytochrome b561
LIDRVETGRLSPRSLSAPLEARRYTRAAIGLHWTIAVLILVQIALGWIMNEVLPDHTPIQSAVETIHISLGLTILILVVARIVVRLVHPPPPLPSGMPIWERLLSTVVHLIFYGLMLALPLTGWALVSLGDHPISFWGLPWPHLPGVRALLGNPVPKATRQALKHIHVYVLIWIVFLNLALHVGGALKHQSDGRPVLWRMTGLKRPTRSVAS